MLNHSEPRWITFSEIIKAVCLLGLFLCSCVTPLQAAEQSGKILSRPDLNQPRRDELAGALRRITGWTDLGFDQNGALKLGHLPPLGGSATARALLASAMEGNGLMVLEDASDRQDVVFCSVVKGRWTKDADKKPPVYIVLIDFTDFSYVTGDQAALAAFNAGWGVLHEIEHVVNGSVDAEREGEVGECENLINRMRRECGLAERAEYYFSYFPGAESSGSMTRLVRMAFDEQDTKTNRKRRYWIVWDAGLVGGLSRPQAAALR